MTSGTWGSQWRKVGRGKGQGKGSGGGAGAGETADGWGRGGAGREVHRTQNKRVGATRKRRGNLTWSEVVQRFQMTLLV